MKKNVILPAVALFPLFLIPLVASVIGPVSPSQTVSCKASLSFEQSDTGRSSTPLEAVRAEIDRDGDRTPSALTVVFRYPSPAIHDVRVRADWEDRSEYYGVGGSEVNGTIQWLAEGPLNLKGC